MPIPAGTQILGVLDTNLSLAKVDAEPGARDARDAGVHGRGAARCGLPERAVRLDRGPQSAARTEGRNRAHRQRRSGLSDSGALARRSRRAGAVVQRHEQPAAGGAGRNHRVGAYSGRARRREDARAEAGAPAHAARGEDGDHRQDGGGGRARDQQSAVGNPDLFQAGEALDREEHAAIAPSRRRCRARST